MIRNIATVMLVMISLPVWATDLAKVNGTAITVEDFNAFTAQFPKAPNFEKAPPRMRFAILDSLIKRELLVQAAKKKGIDKKVTGKDANERKNAAANLLIKSISEDPQFKDEVLRKKYNKGGTSFMEFNIRHILLKTEKEAKAVLKKIKNLKDFSTTAKTKSMDITSKQGGAIGWIGPGSVAPSFYKALDKKGLVDNPIKSAFGWHVVYIEDKRKLNKPTFDTIKNEYREETIRAHIQSFMKSLEQKANIQLLIKLP